MKENSKKYNKDNFKEVFSIEKEDMKEAKENLIGFFGVLYKIDQRIKKEQELKSIPK